jgi:hypothetical protein
MCDNETTGRNLWKMNLRNSGVKRQGNENNEMYISSVSIIYSCAFICEGNKKTFSEKRKQTYK